MFLQCNRIFKLNAFLRCKDFLFKKNLIQKCESFGLVFTTKSDEQSIIYLNTQILSSTACNADKFYLSIINVNAWKKIHLAGH